MNHNKNFKTEAEKRGLKISQAKYIGWSVTYIKMDFGMMRGWEKQYALDSANINRKEVSYGRL